MAVRRELIEQETARDGRLHSMLRPAAVIVGTVGLVIGGSVMITRHFSWGSDEKEAQDSDGQVVEPNLWGVEELVALAKEEEERRRREEPAEGATTREGLPPEQTPSATPGAQADASGRLSAPAPPAPDDRLTVVRERPPTVEEILGQAPGDPSWDEPGATAGSKAAALARVSKNAQPAEGSRSGTASGTAPKELTPEELAWAQYRHRVLERRLRAREERQFEAQNRLTGDEEEDGRGRRRRAASDDEDDGELGALGDLKSALLKQSARQITEGGELGGLGSIASLMAKSGSSEDDERLGNREANKLDFFKNGGSQLQPGTLNATVQRARPYELKMGHFIPGVLLTAVSSEAPGQIQGRVSEHVYDTATGCHLLIPQGSTIVGTYSGAISLGQERVQVAAVRLNFPNGDSIDLGGMAMGDPAGMAGFRDRVNQHLWRRIGAFLLSTSATVGYEMTRPRNGLGIEGAVHRGLGEAVLQMANDMARRDSQIPPTLEIRNGYRFSLQISKDIVFPGPYRDGLKRTSRKEGC